MRKNLAIKSATRTGAVLPLVAVTLVALMSVLALAIDGGSLQRQRRLAQNAADAGALAGAWEIYRDHNTDDVVYATAQGETARNGFTNGEDGVVVTPSRGAVSDYYHGPQYVKVVVEKTIPTPFAWILGRSSVIVRARAWGGTISPSHDCIVALASTGYGLHVQDHSTMDADNCTFRINSSSSNAFEVQSGGPTIDMPGGSISVTGGPPTEPPEVTGNPTYTTGVAPLPDPFGTVAAPTGFSTTCDAAHTNWSKNSGTWTLSPGVYCGGIDARSNAQVNFSEGLYILLGGGLNFQDNGVRVRNTGAGVTFYNTYDGGHPFTRVTIKSGTDVQLYADPAGGHSGTIAGILFFGDRSVTTAILPSTANEFYSGVGLVLGGALYFPSQDVRLQDQTSSITIDGGSIVAKHVWVQSGVEVVFNSAGGGGGTGWFGITRAAVIE